MRRKPKRGEVWIGGSHRVLITSRVNADPATFVGLAGEGKGTTVRCLSMTELSSMMQRGEVVQSRHPCPVHGEPEFPPGTFLVKLPRPSGQNDERSGL